MKITNQMVNMAMKKATEAGLLPRHASREDVLINQELIRAVLQSALDAAPGAALVLNPGASATSYDVVANKRTFSPLSVAQLLVSFPL